MKPYANFWSSAAPRRVLGFVAVAAALVGLASGSPPAGAQCSYPALTSGVVTSLGDGATPQITMGVPYWTAVGVRGPGSDDWDISVNSSTTGAPPCVSGILGNSTYTAGVADFVVGDFNSGGNPHGTYYVRSYRFGGTGTSAEVEWDSGVDQLGVNDMRTQRNTGPGDVLECWDVFLNAGTTYTLTLISYGTAATRAFLFRNPANSPYWVGRSSRVLEVGPGPHSMGTYTVPTSDWYGIVVVNDNGQSGTYEVGIGTCTSPTPLASGTAVTAYGASTWWSFTQNSPYFTAVAVRSDDPAQDWDLSVHSGASGNNYPMCLSGPGNTSIRWPGVDLIVGDFNGGANPTGTYYARAYPVPLTTSAARVEWDDGADILPVDGSSVLRNTGPNDIIEVWDVRLVEGQWYSFNFAHNGDADLKYIIFRNPGSTYWVTRDSGDEYTGSEQYLAQATDWYGVVVVNDNGGTGTYRLGVSTCPSEAIALTPNNTVYTWPAGNYVMQFEPDPNKWVAFATRSRIPAPTQDWDLKVFSDFTGGTPSSGCASGLLATSDYGLPAGTDFVVGDMRANGPMWAFGFPYPDGPTFADAYLMWDEADSLTVGGPVVIANITPTDIVHVYEVFLTSGVTYSIFFDQAQSAILQYSVYGNPAGTPYWAGRGTGLVLDTNVSTDFTAPATGWYAIVVASDREETDTYYLGVYQTGVAAEESPPARTRLAGIAPNPARGGSTRISYELATPGELAFEVFDLAGRRVARMDPPGRTAGRASFAWNGRAEDGRNLGAGVYFVRMVLEGRTVDRARLIVLH